MIRVGTRASALALAQAAWVADQLPAATLVKVTNPGDRGERAADKSRWVSELERALLDGRIDVAVHSAKDVPAVLAEGTEIVAIPRREDPRDALVGAASLAELRAGARVGTSSLRRAAQLRARRDDLEIVELHGNIDTRLRRQAAGEFGAIVLAAAGLRRLGCENRIDAMLDELVPAPGQGALIVQGRTGHTNATSAGGSTTHPPTRRAVLAERSFAAVIGASCNTAVGAHADPGPEPMAPDSVRLRAWVGLPDGSEWIADELTGPFDEVGSELAERMLKVGAGDLLARAEATVATSDVEVGGR